MTTLVESFGKWFSDRGSIPLASTKRGSVELFFYKNEFALVYRLGDAWWRPLSVFVATKRLWSGLRDIRAPLRISHPLDARVAALRAAAGCGWTYRRGAAWALFHFAGRSLMSINAENFCSSFEIRFNAHLWGFFPEKVRFVPVVPIRKIGVGTRFSESRKTAGKHGKILFQLFWNKLEQNWNRPRNPWRTSSSPADAFGARAEDYLSIFLPINERK